MVVAVEMVRADYAGPVPALRLHGVRKSLQALVLHLGSMGCRGRWAGCANTGLTSLSLHRVFKKASPNGKVSVPGGARGSSLSPACGMLS